MEKNYKPDFKWGKDEAGNPCITDNGSIAAKFYGGTDRLPEDKSAALRPVSLHALRLAPGGPAMIDEGETCGPLCLSWRKHLIFNMEVEELKTDDTDPECFKLFVRTMDTALRLDRRDVKNYKPGNIIEETYLELFYDAVLGSYVYDVRTSLKIKPGREEFVLANDLRGLEFGDILPSGAFDNFPPLGDKKYTHIVYKGADGRLYNRPQNRHLGPDKRNIFYSPDGFLAFVAEKHGNPVVQFLDGSGSLLWSEICWAMYDVHFKCNKDMEIQHIKKGIPLGIRYKLYSVSHREAEHMLASSSPDPVLSHPLVRCPVFSGRETNYFEPSEEYLKPSDKWFWQMSETSCFWDWKTG
ncbi:MAG TPA: hypothetical protein PKN36_08590, partial [bacterium]|nr:hypothetical protein [bacterium]